MMLPSELFRIRNRSSTFNEWHTTRTGSRPMNSGSKPNSMKSRVWPLLHPALTRPVEAFCRRFIRWQVKDPALAAALTPSIRFGCKRVLISNAWYPMFNRPNVELVTAGIREVSEHGIVTDDGVERPVDCIILGTGFVVDPRIYMQNFPVTGLPGRNLAADWKAPGGEEARLMMRAVPRYGRGGTRADDYARRISRLFTDLVTAKPTPAGSKR